METSAHVTGQERVLSGSGYSELHSLALHCSNPSQIHSSRDSISDSLKLLPGKVLFEIRSQDSSFHCVCHNLPAYHSFTLQSILIINLGNCFSLGIVLKHQIWSRRYSSVPATDVGGPDISGGDPNGGQRTNSWRPHDLGVTLQSRTLQNFRVAPDGVNHENLRETKVQIKFIKKIVKVHFFFFAFALLFSVRLEAEDGKKTAWPVLLRWS